MRLWVCAFCAAAAALGACGRGASPSSVPSGSTFTLAGQYVVASNPTAAPQVRIGGLSGLATLGNGRELLALSDDRKHPRVFRMTVGGAATAFRLDVTSIIYLKAARSTAAHLDPEGIAITRDGHMLITSEGVANSEARVAPAIIEYSSDGQFVRQLHVRSRYSPNQHGAVTLGVRDNAGFEALAMSPDYKRFFTGTELPLAQDGDANSFLPGARSRLLEYTAVGGSYEPGREFVYEIEPLQRPSYPVRFAISGLVELLSLGGDVLLALERGFVESEDRQQSMNRIRLFRLDLGGATDVSQRDSLLNATDLMPVRKTLVLDVNTVRGLAPPLTRLDNFEGMTWGPPLGGGARPLILVSDDNFSERQVTGFLLLRPGRRSALH